MKIYIINCIFSNNFIGLYIQYILKDLNRSYRLKVKGVEGLPRGGDKMPSLQSKLKNFWTRESPEQREQRMVDRQIQEQLDREQAMQKKTHKLLLLGTGDSGKTTFVKQMKILYGGGFEEKEVATYKVHVMIS